MEPDSVRHPGFHGHVLEALTLNLVHHFASALIPNFVAMLSLAPGSAAHRCTIRVSGPWTKHQNVIG